MDHTLCVSHQAYLYYKELFPCTRYSRKKKRNEAENHMHEEIVELITDYRMIYDNTSTSISSTVLDL